MESQSHHKEVINKDTYIKYVDDGSYVIKPMGLKIIWGGDSRYWSLPEKKEKIADPVELLQVNWLQLCGTLDLKELALNTNYKISFKLEMKPDAFGWSGTPVYLGVKVGSFENFKWNSVILSAKAPEEIFTVPESGNLEFKTPAGSSDEKLYFGLYEIWKGRWKGGMVIHEVVIEKAHNP